MAIGTNRDQEVRKLTLMDPMYSLFAWFSTRPLLDSRVDAAH